MESLRTFDPTNNDTMKKDQLTKEYKKLSKVYFELEEKEFRTFDEQKDIDAIEIRLAEISNQLEAA